MKPVDRRFDSRLRARRSSAVFMLALVIGAALGCSSILGLERPLYDDEAAKPSQPSDGGRYAPDGALLPSGPLSEAGEPLTNLEGEDSSLPKPVCAGAPDCERVVFVTSKLYAGNLGALGGADTLCTRIAAETSHVRIRGRKFRAWLSVVTESAATHLVHGTKPYRLPNGVMIASDFNELLGAGIRVPVSLTEHGITVATPTVWTGTKVGGSSAGFDCAGWTNPTGDAVGTAGSAKTTSSEWTNSGPTFCNSSARLYCIEE